MCPVLVAVDPFVTQMKFARPPYGGRRIASICHGQHSRASSLDVRKYALGLSRLQGGRYECDCAYQKLHLALQSLAKDHVIMRYMPCRRKLQQ